MRRAAIALAVAAALAGAARAAEPEHVVAIPGSFYAPAELDALVGETVSWRNSDHRAHTVTSDADEFDSGGLGSGATFSRTFAAEGDYVYHCRFHRFMRGVVHVRSLLLLPSARTPAVGAVVLLRGRSPRAGEEVVLERVRNGTADVAATTTADGAGAFVFPVRVERAVTFRVRSGTATSGPVRLAPRPRVELRVRGGVARIVSTPARAGAAVRIEAYNRERFDWSPYARAKLGRNGSASVRVAPRRPLHLRARVVAGGGFAEATSRVVLVRP